MKPKKKKISRGNINVAMMDKYEIVAKASKMSGMTPTAFARIALENVAMNVLSGNLTITAPQIVTAT